MHPHPLHEDHARRCAALAASGAGIPLQADVFRSVRPKYADPADILSGEGYRKAGNRWNAAGSFPAVYASSSPVLCMEESTAFCARFNLPFRQATPRITVTIEVRLQHVLDLTDPAVRRRLRVSLQALRGDRWWMEDGAGRESLCQSLGRAAHEAGYEGIRVPSAHTRRGWNLVLFPRNLCPSSRTAVVRER